ncbi:MAG: hypothetical protein ACFE94_07375 [Candidatus Hodarchaeota archaeon]
MEKLTEERFEYLLSYSEERLQSLAHEQIWKGKGTKFDPFVVKNANILGQAILLNKTFSHLSFFNCNFDFAQFEGCQNILLKNCTFKKLVLYKCKKFKFDESSITDLNFSKAKDISFKNSIIFNVSTKFRIKNIRFNNCQVNNDFLDYVLSKSCGGLYSKTKELVTTLIIILGFIFLPRFIYLLFILNPSEIILLLLLFIRITTLLLIFLLISYLYENMVKKKHPKIKILNNK